MPNKHKESLSSHKKEKKKNNNLLGPKMPASIILFYNTEIGFRG